MPKQVDLGYKLWGPEDSTESSENSGEAGEAEQPSRLPADSSSTNGTTAAADDLDGTYWEPPPFAHPEDYEDAHDSSSEADAQQQGHRFRRFAAREERLAYASNSGWFALEQEEEQQEGEDNEDDFEDSSEREQDAEPEEDVSDEPQLVDRQQSGEMLADSDGLLEERSSSSNGTGPQLVTKPLRAEGQAESDEAQEQVESADSPAEEDRNAGSCGSIAASLS